MQDSYKKILESIGEDPTREGLLETPKRAAQAMEFLTEGYHQNLDSIINNALFTSDRNDMVIVKKVEMYSMCEHHLLPFLGECHIGYIPNGQVLGLSKIARIVDFFSRRLQIQERLTYEIANCIQSITQAHGVGIVIEAKHLCMMMRGVEKQHSLMTTSVMLGEFRDNPQTRSEFLSLIRD